MGKHSGRCYPQIDADSDLSSILYMLFGAIPIVYEENRGWSPVAGTLPFLSVLTGCFIAAGEFPRTGGMYLSMLTTLFSHQHHIQQYHLPPSSRRLRRWESRARNASAPDDAWSNYIPGRILHCRLDKRSEYTLVPKCAWICLHRNEFLAYFSSKFENVGKC
jgi:hypothetical protein